MSVPLYRDDPTYTILESLCIRAGVEVKYTIIPDDQIDGTLWARSNDQQKVIEMPDTDCFDSPEKAAIILGHEMAHILAGVDSSDLLIESVMNEAFCDLLGGYLYKLSELIAGTDAEKAFLQNC